MKTNLLTKPLKRQTPPRERLTYAEFCSRVHEQKADPINGEIIMASPARIKHEDFVDFWKTVFRRYVKKKELGRVIGSRVAMKFSEHDAPEPDIMFVKKERLHLLGETEIFGPADLVVEVVSPGSRRVDFVDKREVYADYGVQEYWLIDFYRQQAFFWKNVNGIGEDLPVDANGVVRSETLPGFWLRIDWLFAAEEELDELEILETILTEYPAAKGAV
jgi:Uma2 family endonuclease